MGRHIRLEESKGRLTGISISLEPSKVRIQSKMQVSSKGWEPISNNSGVLIVVRRAFLVSFFSGVELYPCYSISSSV